MATPNNEELDLVRVGRIKTLQEDLNFYRERLCSVHGKIKSLETISRDYLFLINRTKRMAHEEGIELK